MNQTLFNLQAKFVPKGDQEGAIKSIVERLNEGRKHQVLLGATGTGKTFTMANVIAQVQKPTLILAHNKTLAAQLASEFREFFPDNAVRYFVSYYDYYQPEAYIPRTDTFIEKESETNEEIEKYRNAATQSLLTRKDVLIVASVSAIYGLGNPDDYSNLSVTVIKGESYSRQKMLRHLTDMQYERNDIAFERGTFRVKGDTIDVFASYEDNIIRIEFFGDEIDSIKILDVLTGEVLDNPSELQIFPAKQYVTPFDKLKQCFSKILDEKENRVKYFKDEGKFIEAERINQRVNYDLEMLNEVGYCNGIENYSRVIEGRPPGSAPSTLLDYFPDDYLLMIDESHITIPQVRGMHNGDRARKETLVNYGFRLPSAMDNRPLRFDEFYQRFNQAVYVSATPSDWEMSITKEEALTKNDKLEGISQQIIRPTGLLDPVIEIRPSSGQIPNLKNEIDARIKVNQRILVTTLTKRMAEELTNYLLERNYKVQYLHSDIETIERVEILRDLRLGLYDIVIGINLLREGLDLPEVSLVAILDADKEGFLRSSTSLIQTIGRAARHVDGKVIMYADRMTDSMNKAIDETKRRREVQDKYNLDHGITPISIKKDIKDQLIRNKNKEQEIIDIKVDTSQMTAMDIKKTLVELRTLMKKAAQELDFEKAANLRDKIKEIQAQQIR